MAPLPDNNTLRFWYDYTSGGLNHSLLLRLPGTGAPTTADYVKINAIGNALLDCMADSDSIYGSRYSVKGSLVSLPAAGIGGNGALSGATNNPESRAGFAGMSGRSAAGRRYHFDLYTLATYGLTEFRIPYSSIAANFQTLLDIVVQGGVSGGTDLVAIDGQVVNFKNYFNIGIGAYWQRKQR